MKSLLGTLCIAAGIAVPCPSSPGGEPEGWVLVLSSADMLKDSFLLKSSDQQMNLNLFRNVFETTEFKDQLPGIGDSSMEKVSEVSRPMRDILSRLRDTVHVRYYLSKELPGAFADLRNETIALLEKMAAVSGGHLGYDVVEPDEEARAYAAAKVESYYAALGEGKTPPEPRQESIEDLFKGRPRKTDAEIRGERKEKAAAISRDPKAGVSAEDLYRKIITEEFREVYLADLEKRGIRSVPFMERKGEESIETVLFSSIEVKYLSREPEVLPVHFQVQSLEHELALMVLKLTAKSRPKFLFFDGRKPQAKPSNPMDPGAARSASEHSAVLDACRELFDLEEITLEEGDSIGDVKRRIDEDWKKAADRAADEKPARIACLIVAHPSVLAPRQVNEIAEAVGEGIPTVFLVSSFSVDVSDEGMKKGIPITRHSSGLEDLFRTWGIGLGKDMLASPDCGDLTIPQQVAGALATVQIPSPMPFLVKAARDSIIQDHPLTKHCPSLVFPAAVELEIDGEGVKKAGLQATVIATSGKRSYTVPIAGAAKDQSGNDRPPSAVENKLLTDQGAYKDRFIEPKVLAVLLTGKFPSPSRGKPAPDWIEWWVEPAARKVFLDSPPGNVKSIDLAAARGEWESAQVVVRPKRQVSLRSAAGPALKGPADALIGEKANELRRVSFVPVPYAGRAYPDPLADPGFGTSSFPADSASPLLITVRVPRDVRPGAYQGTLRLEFAVLSDDKEDPKEETISVPVALRVWPFEIPERPSVKTAFGLSMDCALRCEGLKPGTPEARAMHERYYRVLLDHRISPYEIPVDLLDPEAGKFLDDPRVTSFQIPFRDDLAWVKARVERCREKGWLERAYFYPWDEPVTDEQYAALRSGSGKIRSLDPKLRIVSPFYCDAKSGKSAYDALEGLITIWCSVSAYFKPDRMEEKRKAGGEVWWYVCCGPGEPYANLHLTMDAMAHRILPWQMALHRIDGFLYWSTTYWNAEHLKDPWEDMVTVPAINKQLSGDGSLLYPGMRGGRRVAEGPVASLRLLLLRDGFEDLEYLVLLEKAAGRAAVDEAVKRLTPDLTRFTKDPAELERVRREVAARISQSKG